MKRAAALALVGAALISRAATTNEVDVAALIAAVDAGLSTTNGWTLSGLGKYAASGKKPACVKFDTINDWLLSPDYGAPVMRIEATSRCSSTAPTRWLHVLDGTTEGDLGRFPACSAVDTMESQSFNLDAEPMVSRVMLKLGGSGNTGNWGIGSLRVITADPAYAPSGLRVSKKGDDWCALSWENGAGTVSNRVDAFLVERGAGEEVLFETGFDGFDRAVVGSKDLSNQLASLLGDASVSGERVYVADGTNGVCQIGTTSNKGFLRYSGVSDWSNAELRLVMKKYDYAEDANEIQIAWETDAETNKFKTVAISTEFSEYIVELSSVQPPIPANAAIVIGYYSGVGGKRRVLIDSMSIVCTGAAAIAPLGSRWLPASPGPASFSTRGVFAIPAKAECRFDVLARNADGLLSTVSTVETRLGGLPGFRFILR